MIVTLFWILIGIELFAFVGFPLLVVGLGLLLQRRHGRADVTPRVSILIAAHNEAKGIATKVSNGLDQRYPADRLEIVVVNDGSTDTTGDEVRRMSDPRVRLLELPTRGGKVAALNRGMTACSGEIIVFTDANAEFERNALGRLVRAFADPEVGGVCGNQLNRSGRGALAVGERMYWEYDKFLKRMESLTGSIVAADGSIYAVRREHLEPIPDGVTDDFFISTGVVAAGKRLVFADSARSYEAPLERRGDHFRRRVRITQQALQSLACRRELMNPRRFGIYAVILIGHKLVRRLAAPLLFVLFPVSALAAGNGTPYLVVFVLQAMLYVAAALGWAVQGRGSARLLAAPYYFVLGMVGTTVGLIRFLSGRRSLMWEPVRR